MTISYPAGPVTPHGWWHIINGTQPLLQLTAHDESIRFHLMGGYAIPDRYAAPEAAHLVDLDGLIAPWQHIDQKGATEDGVHNIDTLYDPIEIEAKFVCSGRTARSARKVASDLIASIDAKKTSQLSWYSQDLGKWWADVRWFKGAPTIKLKSGRKVPVALRLRADNGFWRSDDDVAMFAPSYEAITDTFTTDYETTLGPDWPQRYSGSGGGYCHADDDQARWVDDPDDPTTTSSREVVNGPYVTDTATDNQVINMVLGSIPEITLGDGAYNDLWGRMNRTTGAWGGAGVRARIGMNNVLPWIRLSYFDGFTEHLLTERPMLVMPVFGEKFTLICGQEGDPHMFQVLRNGLPILQHRSEAPNIGASYRGYGFGMRAGAALITQATPANVRKVSAGDNTTVTQTGYIKCSNVGDQPMYRDYTLFGPGLFRIYDGPGSTDYVEFGPLLTNQIVFLRTDPRTHTALVQDLTVTPPTAQELNIFQNVINQILTFAGADTNKFLQQFQSAFGIRTAQGPLYSLLRGRFTQNSAIPPKSPGASAQPYYVRVDIDDGDANSKVISAGTPLRRYPL